MRSRPRRRSDASTWLRTDAGSPVLRALGVTGCDPRRVDVVAALRGDDDRRRGAPRMSARIVSPIAGVAVDRRGVEEGDAGVERGVRPVPACRRPDPHQSVAMRPGAEPDLRDGEARCFRSRRMRMGSGYDRLR